MLVNVTQVGGNVSPAVTRHAAMPQSRVKGARVAASTQVKQGIEERPSWYQHVPYLPGGGRHKASVSAHAFQRCYGAAGMRNSMGVLRGGNQVGSSGGRRYHVSTLRCSLFALYVQRTRRTQL